MFPHLLPGGIRQPQATVHNRPFDYVGAPLLPWATDSTTMCNFPPTHTSTVHNSHPSPNLVEGRPSTLWAAVSIALCMCSHQIFHVSTRFCHQFHRECCFILKVLRQGNIWAICQLPRPQQPKYAAILTYLLTHSGMFAKSVFP